MGGNDDNNKYLSRFLTHIGQLTTLNNTGNIANSFFGLCFDNDW